jgi:hypothetical protein
MPIVQESNIRFSVQGHTVEQLAAGLVTLQRLVDSETGNFYLSAVACQRKLLRDPKNPFAMAFVKSLEYEGETYLLDISIFRNESSGTLSCHTNASCGPAPLRLTAERWDYFTELTKLSN